MNKVQENNLTVTCHKKPDKWYKKLKEMKRKKEQKKLKTVIKVISFHKEDQTVNHNQMTWINKNFKNFMQISFNQWNNFDKKLVSKNLKIIDNFHLSKNPRKKQ